MLFGPGYALQTVLMWIIFFCSLMNLFLFIYWMPEVLHLTGMTPAAAARATSFRELGAILAVVYLGVLIDRFGPERALAWHYAAGIVFIALIALVAMPYLLLVIVIFLSGMTIIGSQTGANAACGKLYPARMRTSGLGWALGIGRLGGIAAPIFGGYLLRTGMAPTAHFPERLLLRAGGRGGDGIAGIARDAHRTPVGPVRLGLIENRVSPRAAAIPPGAAPLRRYPRSSRRRRGAPSCRRGSGRNRAPG